MVVVVAAAAAAAAVLSVLPVVKIRWELTGSPLSRSFFVARNQIIAHPQVLRTCIMVTEEFVHSSVWVCRRTQPLLGGLSLFYPPASNTETRFENTMI
eukprot:123819-Ditylum_brightwellii.AAC.1